MIISSGNAPITILLVEDNPDHAELVIRNFEDQPRAQIRHIPDGEQALDYLFQRGMYEDVDQHPRPHVILLDLQLPKVNGLDVLKEIRGSASLHEIPVVVLTTSKADPDIGEAYQRHVNSYLVKPVNFADFTQLMDDLGGYWLGWNRYPPRAESS